IVGALLAPILYWPVQALAAHGVFPFLAKYGFDTFFHRAILIAAVFLLWPLLRVSNVRGLADLGLAPNPHWIRHVATGVLLSVIPLLFCGALLIVLHVYSFRHVFVWPRLGKMLLAAASVPFIEETFFRGIVLGMLFRTGRKLLAIVAASALFAAVHFLKGSEWEPAIVTWTSGFQSMGDAFAGFADPMMFQAAVSLLYPATCSICGKRVRAGEYLCEACEAKIVRIVPPFCETCSEPFEGSMNSAFTCANCAHRRIHFETAVAAYRGRGVVR